MSYNLTYIYFQSGIQISFNGWKYVYIYFHMYMSYPRYPRFLFLIFPIHIHHTYSHSTHFPSPTLYSPIPPQTSSFLFHLSERVSYPCQDAVKKCDNSLDLQWLVWTCNFCKTHMYIYIYMYLYKWATNHLVGMTQ